MLKNNSVSSYNRSMRGSKSVFQLGLGQRKYQINSRHDQFRKEKANISLLQAGMTWKWEEIRLRQV